MTSKKASGPASPEEVLRFAAVAGSLAGHDQQSRLGTKAAPQDVEAAEGLENDICPGEATSMAGEGSGDLDLPGRPCCVLDRGRNA